MKIFGLRVPRLRARQHSKNLVQAHKHKRKRNAGTIAHAFSAGGAGLKPLTRGVGRGLRIIK